MAAEIDAVEKASDTQNPYYLSITGGILLDLSQVSIFHQGRTIPGSALVSLVDQVLQEQGVPTITKGRRVSAAADKELEEFVHSGASTSGRPCR
jgi:hypothetical protein